MEADIELWKIKPLIKKKQIGRDKLKKIISEKCENNMQWTKLYYVNDNSIKRKD